MIPELKQSMGSGINHLFPFKSNNTIDQIIINNFSRIFKVSEGVIRDKHESKGQHGIDLS